MYHYKAKVNSFIQKQENNEVTVKDNEKNVTEIKNKYSEWSRQSKMEN